MSAGTSAQSGIPPRSAPLSAGRPSDRDRTAEPRGFRPSSRRRTRIAGGAALAALAIGGNVLVYASLDDRTEVLQVVTDIRAGDVVTPESLRIVAVDVDATVPVVAADDLALVVGRHARVHIASGSLLSSVLLQPTPLLAPDSAVVAIEIRPTRVPDGLRERSLIELIVADELRTTARVVTRPRAVDGISGVVSMSVEVAVADAATVASGDDVRVIVLEPGLDPVYDGGD